MKVLFLTNNENSLALYKWLLKYENVILVKHKIDLPSILQIKPDFIVSYNYSYIIKSDVIQFMNGKIVNLHISYLPYNRGASPNFWSFIDDTPKGVTIHYIDEGLDTGDILVQKRVYFNEDIETFQSSYLVLHEEIQKLFMDNWVAIKEGKLISRKQEGAGTAHMMADLKRIDEVVKIVWNENITRFKQRVKKLDRSW